MALEIFTLISNSGHPRVLSMISFFPTYDTICHKRFTTLLQLGNLSKIGMISKISRSSIVTSNRRNQIPQFIFFLVSCQRQFRLLSCCPLTGAFAVQWRLDRFCRATYLQLNCYLIWRILRSLNNYKRSESVLTLGSEFSNPHVSLCNCRSC